MTEFQHEIFMHTFQTTEERSEPGSCPGNPVKLDGESDEHEVSFFFIRHIDIFSFFMQCELLQRRHIIEQQDQEFAESLRIDQERYHVHLLLSISIVSGTFSLSPLQAATTKAASRRKDVCV